MGKPIVGMQLYSLREFETTEQDLAETAKKVAAIGYTAVQISGIKGIDPKAIKQIMDDNGLTIGSTHDAWTDFLEDIDAMIAKYQLYGARHMAIGGVPPEYRTMEGLDRFEKEFASIGGAIAAAGMTFSYHNHNQELAHFNGRTWLEQLYERMPKDTFKAEIDVHWIAAGGGDPAQWIAKYPGRQPLVHLKDMVVTVEREQRFAPVGEGNLNWPRILKEAEAAGAEFLFVEQDRFYEDQDPFEEVAKSYNNLKALGFE